jgi:hypothetical protein
MTEAEWLSCKDLAWMLRFLEGKASERKLRLFVVACCRRVPRLMRQEVCRQAVEVAERFADGAASRNDLEETYDFFLREIHQSSDWSADRWVRYLASGCVRPDLISRDADIVSFARNYTVVSRQEENRVQVRLLKDIFGNPFHPLSVLDPALLSWNDGTIPKLARAIYEERCFEDLPILGDALEEAGCTNVDILNHCRQHGEHVRGCLALDLILGKE